MRQSWLHALLLPSMIAACGRGGPVAEPPAPRTATTAAITAAELRTRISVFADDSMQGRRTGSPGNVKANSYIAAEAARIGLRPAGENGSFLQQVPLTSYAVDPAKATLRSGTTALTVFEDYFPYQAVYEVPARSIDGAPLLYLGGVADTASLPTREELRGKIVVFRSDAEGNTTVGAPDLRPGGRFGLIAGIVVTGIDALIGTFQQQFRAPTLTLKSSTTVPAGITQPRMIFLPTASVPKLLGKPIDQLRPGDTGPILQGDVRFEPTTLPATNVVAVLQGADPALRGQYLALGAHNDAIGVVTPPVDHDSVRAYNSVMRPRGANDPPGEPGPEQWTAIRVMLDSMRQARPPRIDSIVNGADDDGSGSMALLEVAEAMAASGNRPKRSVLFVWHSGEESGLQGSRWFTDHPTVPRDSIVAQINTDMIGRGGPKDESTRDPTYLQVIGSRRLSTELGDVAETVNRDGGHGFAFDYTYDADGHPDNFYCRSDHYMYARYGIPIAFFSTGGHLDYHQVTDEIEYLDFEKYARVTSFIADFASRVADLDHRPVVDKPKPDPAAPCKQ